MTPLEWALVYAALGWAVFPLVPGTKRPLTPNGFKDATTDTEQIRRWWTENPDAGIGAATGRLSGISVLDADNKPWKNKRGDLTLRALLDQHGALPTTPMQATWSGGVQFVFAYNEAAVTAADENAYGKGLDGRNDGGYIVVPPSFVAEDGREGLYSWLHDPRSVPLAPMPSWLLAQAGAPKKAKKTKRTAAEWAGVVGGVPEGNRQEELPHVVGKLYRAHAPELARSLAHAYGKGCDPALTEQEIDECCDRIAAREAAKLTATEELFKDDPGGERFTDIANAQRLAVEVEGKVAHVAQDKEHYYVFDGARLVREPKAAVVPFVKVVAQRLYRLATEGFDQVRHKTAALEAQAGNIAKAASDEATAEIEKLAKLSQERRGGAAYMERRTGAYAAIELLKAEASVSIKIEQLDAHPLWLNTPSGTINLETGESWLSRFEDRITKVTGAAYDPTATCPRWDAFLSDVLPDVEVRAFMQRTVGYALTDLISQQCLWFLHGTGRNGKSTFLRAISEMLGDYAANTKASTLMVKSHGDDKRNDVAVLRGARFVSVLETEHGQQMAEALIKELTGGDPVTCRLMYAEFFTFLPTFKIMLAANHKPGIKGTDLAVWRRIHLVPFDVTIAEDKVDRSLLGALIAEGSGILNWALAGFRAWRSEGLNPPEAVRAATATYRAESDVLGDFLDEYLLVEPGREVKSSDLFTVYQSWAARNGIRLPLTQPMLGKALRERGFIDSRGTRDSDRAKRWLGIGLRAY